MTTEIAYEVSQERFARKLWQREAVTREFLTLESAERSAKAMVRLYRSPVLITLVTRPDRGRSTREGLAHCRIDAQGKVWIDICSFEACRLL